MKYVVNVFSVMTAIGLFTLMMIVFFDVIARNFIGRPIPGADEISRFVLGVSIFLALPIATFKNDHIVVDLLDFVKSRTFKLIQLVAASLLGTCFFAALTWQLFNQASRAARYNDMTLILNIPVYPFALIMAILSLISAVAVLLSFRRASKEISKELPPSGIQL